MAMVQPSSGSAPPARPGVVQLAWSRYLHQLQTQPLRTKALTAAVIAGTSDVIAQRALNGRHTNMRRTLAVAIYGLLWNGPSAHYWQKFMEVRKLGETVYTAQCHLHASLHECMRAPFVSFPHLFNHCMSSACLQSYHGATGVYRFPIFAGAPAANTPAQQIFQQVK